MTTTASRTVPISQLVNSVRTEDAVEAACASDITFIEERLRRGSSVLVDCDKELSLFLYLAVRARLRRQKDGPKLVVIDGRPRPDDPPGSNLGRMIQQLTDAIRGSVERTIIVLLHLDVLTTTHTGLTLEARESIPLLYENPEAVLLGFRDPSFEIPKVIQGVFTARREITGIPREALAKIVTQREAKAMHATDFDPYGLYKYTSGLNPVRCRKLFADLALRREAPPGRSMAQEVYQEIRKQTVTEDIELPNVDIDNDIGGYLEVKTRMREEVIDLVRRKETMNSVGDIDVLESLLPRGVIFYGPPGTGKTFFAKAMATALNASVIVVSGPELKSKWVGESLPWDEEVFVVRDGIAERLPIGALVDKDYEHPERRPDVSTWTVSDDGRAMLAPVKGFIRHEAPPYIDVLVTETGRRVRVTGGHSLFVNRGGTLAEVTAEQIVAGETRVAIPSRLVAPETVRSIDVLALLAGRADVRVAGYDALVANAVEKVGPALVEDAIGMQLSKIRGRGHRSPLSLASLERVAALADERPLPRDLSLYCWHRNKNMPGILDVTEDLGEFFGWWVAEGCYSTTGVRLAVNEDESAHVRALCERLFGHVTTSRKGEGKGVDLVINSTLLRYVMHDGMGLRDGSSNKRVPPWMFLAPKAVIAAFLRGYFSGDGGFSGKHIEATTTSVGLARDIATMLQFFGIVARLRERAEWSGSTSHRVRFGWSEYLRAFVEQIGFAQSAKQDAVRAYCDAQGLHRYAQTPAPHMTNDVYWDKVVEKRREPYDGQYVYDLSVPGTERFVAGFGNVLVHNSEENLRRIFRQARQAAPSVIIFDEIDAFAHQRGTYVGSGVEHSMVNQLLTEMDGFRKNEMVFVVATTNFLESLDGALMRPGRFEFMIEIPAPGPEDRDAIIRIYNKKFNLDLSDALIKHMVRRTEGLADREKGIPFAGDHIQAVCRALKRQAIRQGSTTFTNDDIDKALQRKTKRPVVLSAHEERVVAVHEAGHALVAMLLPRATPPERISIVADMEGALGYVLRQARARPYAMTEEDMRAEVAVGLGGMAAEKMVFNEFSIGAWNDLQQSNSIVRALVEQYGMSRLGVRVMLEDEDGPKGRTVSPARLEARDIEIDRILGEERARCEQLLKDNEHLHRALVELLLEKKVLDATSIKDFVGDKNAHAGAASSTETAGAKEAQAAVEPASVASAAGGGE